VVGETIAAILTMDTDSPVITFDGNQYVFLAFSKRFLHPQGLTQKDILSSASLGTLVSNLASLTPFSRSTTYQYDELAGLCSSLDPSGTLTRLYQVFKIISRLVYFNLNYGPKLQIFLEHAEQLSGVDKISTDGEMLGSRVGTRAKLTRYKVGVEVMNTIYTWKTGLYGLSMLISQFFALVRSRRPKTSKPLLYVMYFWPRVHFVLLNFCLIDICFITTRIILHSRSQIDIVYSFLLILLLCVTSSASSR